MRIDRAAIQWNKDNSVYCGRNHATIIHQLYAFSKVQPINGIQGFVTNTGKFVDRVEGLQIAKAAGQINYKPGNPNELYSEDINYPNGPN